MAFKALHEKGRENFLVNSDSTLRALLTEYEDHHLVKCKRGSDGIEYLNIPLSNETLQSFLEKRDSE